MIFAFKYSFFLQNLIIVFGPSIVIHVGFKSYNNLLDIPILVHEIWTKSYNTQHFLTLGQWWKTGNGAKINVWNMSWILNHPSLKSSTTPPPSYEDLTVNHLMHPRSTSWDHALVHSLFKHSDATAIIAIPLYSRPIEDSRVWKATNYGSYTVKSAYRICVGTLVWSWKEIERLNTN